MGFFRGVKKGFFSGIQPKKWLDTDGLKERSGFVKETYQNFKDQAVVTPSDESYVAAVKRLGLSEADIQKRVSRHKRLAMVYLLFGLALFIYGLVLGFMSHHMAMIQCFALTFLLLLFFIKEHFMYFRLKKKNLSLNFKDWILFLVGARS